MCASRRRGVKALAVGHRHLEAPQSVSSDLMRFMSWYWPNEDSTVRRIVARSLPVEQERHERSPA
jgi:hypothetical protein